MKAKIEKGTKIKKELHSGGQDNKYFCFKGSHIDFKKLIDVKQFITQYKEIQGYTIEFGHIIYTR